MGKEEKKEAFLENLGRATMRGLRKCKKCGTLNGTRGFSCKNKSCDVIFKEPGGKKKPSTESFKIVTGNDVQIYSVRVRDKGPDFRAFVQFPNDAKIMLDDGYNMDPSALLDAGAKCYVESCSKMNGYVMNATSVCSHLKSAALCYKNAQPLQFGSSVLNALPISSDLKHSIYDLATSTTGPLVQRVSRHLFVVKCIPDSVHPLGFLHITFCKTKGKRVGIGELKFYCSCKYLKCDSTKSSTKNCIHFYACGLIFASDDHLAEEFSYYLNSIRNEKQTKSEYNDSEDDPNVIIQEVVTTSEDIDERSFLILNDTSSGNPCQVEVEVVNNPNVVKLEPAHNTGSQLKSETGVHLRTSDGGTISVHQLPETVSLAGLKRKQDDMQASCTLLALQNSGNKRFHVEDSSHTTKKIILKKESRDLEDDSCSLNFSSWLASVVERMNQTMHYGCSGKPDPLVFHLPKVFFSRLFERIHKCLRLKKGKISEETQNFERKEAVPLGEFTKHTWRLVSVAQVDKVFENNIIPLEVTKYFIQQPDGSYKNCPKATADSLPMKSQEYKTVLRLGSNSNIVPTKEHPASFIIEWIPDILPQTQIGELRIRFEYDHYCNERMIHSKPFILSPVNTPSKSQLKMGQPAIAPRPTSNQKFSLSAPTSNNENVLSFPLPSDSISSGESITLLTF